MLWWSMYETFIHSPWRPGITSNSSRFLLVMPFRSLTPWLCMLNSSYCKFIAQQTRIHRQQVLCTVERSGSSLMSNNCWKAGHFHWLCTCVNLHKLSSSNAVNGAIKGLPPTHNWNTQEKQFYVQVELIKTECWRSRWSIDKKKTKKPRPYNNCKYNNCNTMHCTVSSNIVEGVPHQLIVL